jgi:predicted aldo/keto reductase-like oxidoreductase
MSISRREFLGTTALGATAGPLLAAKGDNKAAMPKRVLGKTGARVSILAFGSGSRFLKYEDDAAVEALTRALDHGITYVDTADDYGKDHRSEKLVGKALKGRRQGIFLATKLSDRDGEKSRRIVEESLKALQVDQIDLVHIHSLVSMEDLAKIEAKGGVLEQLQKIKSEKLIRFVGITSHADPEALKAALERHDFDVTQMALNAGQVNMMSGKGGMVPNNAMRTSFQQLALPVAHRKKMGVIAMKVMAQDALIGQATPEKLMQYSLSLPVTAVVIGMPKVEHIDENVKLAKAFKPMTQSEMKQLAEPLSERNKQALDRFFAGHVDA